MCVAYRLNLKGVAPFSNGVLTLNLSRKDELHESYFFSANFTGLVELVLPKLIHRQSQVSNGAKKRLGR